MSRKHASRTNLFPEERKGRLNKSKLVKHGLTKQKLIDGDALFFFQCLMPIADKKNTGIDGDERMPYYTNKVRWSNTYKLQSTTSGVGLGATKEITVPEEVNFDGILFYHGASGVGMNHAIHKRWDTKGNCQTSERIKRTMSYPRWLQIKRFSKLNDNKDSKLFLLSQK